MGVQKMSANARSNELMNGSVFIPQTRWLMKDVHLATFIWNSDGRDCDCLCVFQSAQFYFWPSYCVDISMWSALIRACEGVQRTMPYCVLFCFAFYLLEIMEKCLQNLSSTRQTVLSRQQTWTGWQILFLLPDASKFLKDPGACVLSETQTNILLCSVSWILAFSIEVSFNIFLTEFLCWI